MKVIESDMASDPASNMADGLNQHRDGWSMAAGLRYTQVTLDEVVAEFDVGPQHLQAYGIVHGGVHAGVIETLASVGAALNAMQHGQHVVGLENHTSFLRAVRGGRLRVSARPLTRGRKSQVWEGQVSDESGRLVATGRVRLLCLGQDDQLAGTSIEMKTGEMKTDEMKTDEMKTDEGKPEAAVQGEEAGR